MEEEQQTKSGSGLKVILGVLALVALFSWAAFAGKNVKPSTTGNNTIKPGPAKEVTERVVKYINENLLAPEGSPPATLASAGEEVAGLYKFTIAIGEGEQAFKRDLYTTKDGKLVFTQIVDTSQPAPAAQQAPAASAPKSDKVDVKLFVMSYCPFGFQAEKMYLPVLKLLQNKANMGIYFVNYAMHEKQEVDENTLQYCIQKEQNNKFADYLTCFIDKNESAKCLDKVGVDKTKLNACISATDKEFGITAKYDDKASWLNGRFPIYPVHEELNTKYGVQGSPTIVINDTVIDLADRSPEAFKTAICNAFNNAPEECKTTLDKTSPQPGPGWTAPTAAATPSTGGCGQ